MPKNVSLVLLHPGNFARQWPVNSDRRENDETMYVVYGGNIEKNPVTRAAIAAAKEREREKRAERMRQEAMRLAEQRGEPKPVSRPACRRALDADGRIQQDMDMVAVLYRINLPDFARADRQRNLVHARDAAMWMLWYARRMTFSQIGRLLDTDHTTAITGIGRHMDRIGFDHPIREAFIQRKLRQRELQREIAARAKV